MIKKIIRFEFLKILFISLSTTFQNFIKIVGAEEKKFYLGPGVHAIVIAQITPTLRLVKLAPNIDHFMIFSYTVCFY